MTRDNSEIINKRVAKNRLKTLDFEKKYKK